MLYDSVLYDSVLYDRVLNVNTTDATIGATALLLPAQNTHTLSRAIGCVRTPRARRRTGFGIFGGRVEGGYAFACVFFHRVLD